MKTLILAGAAAVLTSTGAFATGVHHNGNPNRPTISIVSVRGVSTGATDLNIKQNADYNRAAAVVLSPRASVNVDQVGRGSNGAQVVVIGNNGGVNIGQSAGRIGNSAAVTVRPAPNFLLLGRR